MILVTRVKANEFDGIAADSFERSSRLVACISDPVQYNSRTGYAEQLFLRVAVCTRNRNVMFEANIKMTRPT